MDNSELPEPVETSEMLLAGDVFVNVTSVPDETKLKPVSTPIPFNFDEDVKRLVAVPTLLNEGAFWSDVIDAVFVAVVFWSVVIAFVLVVIFAVIVDVVFCSVVIAFVLVVVFAAFVEVKFWRVVIAFVFEVIFEVWTDVVF